jgi:hypothetical protein
VRPRRSVSAEIRSAVELETHQPDASAANRTLELLGRELNLFTEKKEVGKPGDFDHMAELIEFIQALGEVVLKLERQLLPRQPLSSTPARCVPHPQVLSCHLTIAVRPQVAKCGRGPRHTARTLHERLFQGRAQRGSGISPCLSVVLPMEAVAGSPAEYSSNIRALSPTERVGSQ